MTAGNPLLVEPDWLEAELDNPSVQVVDCSVGIEPRPPGPSNYPSRYREHIEARIPGASYLHMDDDLSDPAGAFPFALPTPDAVAAALQSRGIAPDKTIVLYGGDVHWATHRCWWVLNACGCHDVRLLNATFDTWRKDARPVLSGPHSSRGLTDTRPGMTPRTHWLSTRADVLSSLDDDSVALVHSLSAEQFSGRGQPFGRPGRIPGSINVPAQSLMDHDTGAFIEMGRMREMFEQAGANDYAKLITYCGGGIAASTTFIALTLLGYQNISLYDGSLLEWSADPSLPLEIDG
ncbi:MAG: hypothetical protein K0U93_11660 [Gammaproteobacteria bacterium]|nr:hypothetical protein [Gammaproteobacteria bacterium]